MDEQPIRRKSSRWILPILVLVPLLILGGLWLVGRLDARKSAPSLGTDTYRQAVASFYPGVTAMEVDDVDRAKTLLDKASQVAPQEPAVWANLAVWYLRAGDLDSAAAPLAEARRLAPNNGKIARIEAVLASRKGDIAKAIELYERAATLDAEDVRAPYALAAEIERQGGADSDAKARAAYEKAMLIRPNNLAVQLAVMRLAARMGDTDGLKAGLERIRPVASSWTGDAAKFLDGIDKAIADGNPKAAMTQVQFLRNVLVQQPGFRADLNAVEVPIERASDPLYTFLTLPNPSPTPAAADKSLGFAPEAPVAAVVAATPFFPNPQATVSAAKVLADGSVSIGDAMLEGVKFPGTPLTAAAIVPVDYANDDGETGPIVATDLVLAGSEGVRIVRQSVSGYADVTATAAPAPAVMQGSFNGVWPVDWDLDGDLDLVVAPTDGLMGVLRNNGDGTFSPIQAPVEINSVVDLAWADFDRDGDGDLAVVRSDGTLVLLLNDRAGLYHQASLPAGVKPVAAVGVADVGGFKTLDLVFVETDGAVRRLTRANGQITGVAEVTTVAGGGLVPGTARLFTADLDNNGATDLIIAGEASAGVVLFDPAYKPVEPLTNVPGRVDGAADFTGDGKLDLLTGDDQTRMVVLRNTATKPYYWQGVRPIGNPAAGDQRVNPLGVGGEISIRAGLLTQAQPITAAVTHFGLGENPQADAVRILWTNGVEQGEFDLPAGAVLAASQRLKGSCPWLFAWDGTDIRFVKDILWRSPLGLKINAVDTASVQQTEDWVLIRGDQLKPRNGVYDLRVTAELWETHFFDHFSLKVVDHPAGTQVLVDERFARQAPPLQVHVTDIGRPVARATDHRGNDVTSSVIERDRTFLGTFNKGRFQGIAEDHWLDVDLPMPEGLKPTGPLPEGNLASDAPAMLVCEGWIYPTDSSINVAISQGDHAPPKGVSVSVPDGNGGWRTVIPDLGFPAGKIKTMLVPLDPTWWNEGEPWRVRLATNLEIYWDQLTVVKRLDARLATTQQLPASVADMRFRGYSAYHRDDRTTPELYDYNRVTTRQRWWDLVGFYTRFGDVRELLAEIDDRYVIANAGDEIRLEFPAPADPAEGMERTYVFVSDGWEKDGDLNTGFSKTVLPLPRHDWPEYDRTTERLEDDEAYKRNPKDWEVYHTRFVGPERFADTFAAP